MTASEEASHEIHAARQRLALARLHASSRVPKQRCIGRKRVEEAEVSLENAETFLKTVEDAEAFLRTVEEAKAFLRTVEEAKALSKKELEVDAMFALVFNPSRCRGVENEGECLKAWE
eukprot:CAMPEP_0201879690 /NCGR_PEP_ID=MMETSP0902-20130614/10514_1 /ASSEMBLY_ACC=CAM_ASM_000551 /TAXON_ID=420261 /ORGANISM="Thalassiosira antarctica, Strain CCMP982" /LENGTH=117 /DNA_ID=CAMNT_0048407587 /DNA_START=36 /DNA_END=390 /DNA_ORIENTATION=+